MDSALHYAASNSTARPEDWVVHMDEETRFTTETVAHVLQHCLQENSLWRQGAPYGHIGQGVICYNTETIESTLCSLADTVRVGDDYGKFALQCNMAAPQTVRRASDLATPRPHASWLV